MGAGTPRGGTLAVYRRNSEEYARAGVDLASLPLVGVGSVCRRRDAGGVRAILDALAETGLRLHAFGLKAAGLAEAAGSLASADSMAWSYAARWKPAMRPCRERHRHCNNCLTYALAWRRRVLDLVDAGDPHAPSGGTRPRLFPVAGIGGR